MIDSQKGKGRQMCGWRKAPWEEVKALITLCDIDAIDQFDPGL